MYLISTIRDITDSKRNEELIRESEEKYRTLVEYNLEGNLILDPKGNILFANLAARDLMGMEPCSDMHAVRNVMEFIAPESQAEVIHDFSRVSQGIDGYIARYKVISGQGEDRWIESIGKSITYEGKSSIHISLRDVTDRQNAENRILERENMFRTIFEYSPYPIAINSFPDTRFLKVNTAFLNASGYSAEEILGKNPIEMGLISYIEATKLISRRVLDGKLENVPLVLTAKGGRRVHVLFSSIPVTINDKAAILTVTAEVTDLKRIEEELIKKNEDLAAAYKELSTTEEELHCNYNLLIAKEQALRASEEKYRLLTEVTNDIIYMIDTKGTITHISPQVSRYGYTPDEILFRQITDFVAEKDLSVILSGIDQILTNNDSTNRFLRIRDKAGNLHWMEDNGVPVVDKSGIVTGISGILRDITDRRNLEEALKQNEEKFRALVENSLEGILIIDFNGTLLFANHAAGTIMDVPDLDSLIGKTNILEYVTPESQGDVLHDMKTGSRRDREISCPL